MNFEKFGKRGKSESGIFRKYFRNFNLGEKLECEEICIIGDFCALLESAVFKFLETFWTVTWRDDKFFLGITKICNKFYLLFVIEKITTINAKYVSTIIESNFDTLILL